MCYVTCYVTCYIGLLQRLIFHVILLADISCYIYGYIINCNSVQNILYMTTLLLCTYIDNTYTICSIICYIRNDIKVHSWLCITTTWLYSS